MSVVSIDGLVVAHVGRRLLLGRTPRQCVMTRHNGRFPRVIGRIGKRQDLGEEKINQFLDTLAAISDTLTVC